MDIGRTYTQAEQDRFFAEAKKIYEKVRLQYEKAHKGEFLVIEPDSGDMFLGADMLDAAQDSLKAHPDKKTYTVRIGYDAVVTLATPFYYVPN